MTPEQALEVVKEIRLIDPRVVELALARINLGIASEKIAFLENEVEGWRKEVEAWKTVRLQESIEKHPSRPVGTEADLENT